MSRLVAFTQSARFGGDDTILIDLIRAWPSGDEWIIILNADHPGLSLYRESLEGRARVVAAPIPTEGAADALGVWGTVGRLRPLFFSARPDAILISSGGFPPTSATMGALIAARTVGPCRRALSIHNEPNMGSGPRAVWRAFRGRIAAWLCDALVSVSSNCAGKIEAACGRPVRTILNGSSALPTESPAVLRAELGIPDGAPLIGTIANIEARKGLRTLIEAFKQLPQPDARLAIIGAQAEPAEAASLKALAADPALNGRVLLCGYRPNARRFAAAFDVCVVPSLRQESFGLLALDAMRAGRPVVATRVGGLPEVVEDEVTGLLVPPGDVRALADAFERLLADSRLALRLGEAGRSRAAERFNVERMAAEYREVLLGNGKC